MLYLVYKATLLQLALFGSVTYSLGVYGIISNNRNLLVLLMCAELALLGLVLNFVFLSVCMGRPLGQVYALLTPIAATAESSVGLALVVLWCTTAGSIDILRISKLRS